jgi:hypothetical protein
MPRKGRGGRRTGTPGKAYSNRTDLNGSQPVRTAPAEHYGDATAQSDAQRAIPLPAMSGGGGGQEAPAGPSIIPLDAPTGRPDEPMTAGMPIGPGPGPEILKPPDPVVRAAAVLNQLGPDADSDTRRLRDIANASLKNQGAE